MHRFDPSRTHFAPYGFTCVCWQPTLMPKPDRHNEIEINLLRSGRLCYLRGGQHIWVEANQVTAFWAAIPHQIVDYENVTDFYVATVPLAWFLAWHPPSALVQRLLQGSFTRDDQRCMADRDLDLFARWVDDLEHNGHTHHKVVLLEMEARLLRLGLGFQPQDTGAAPLNQGLNKADEIAGFVARNYAQPLPVEEISQAVGLHPNYAMALFKRAFGMTLIDYLTKLRVSQAQHLLITTNSKILEVSLNAGFKSISRFNAAFRLETGLTPGEYRTRYRLRSG